MEKQIYRQKNLDQLNSPEQLNNYIRVTTPGVWAVVVCIILLCIGALAWGVFGHIGGASLDNVVVISSGNDARGYVRGSEGSAISGKYQVTMDFYHIGNKEAVAQLKKATLEWKSISDLEEDTLEILMGMGYGQETRIGVIDCHNAGLSEGIYVATITEEGITPKNMVM